ncbi:MAG TPA: fatty acid--CoA ligase family protein [Candidatus Sulfotelmatobacter sp.]|nr:fatty acid--CoA ligase family protein [Candidatus Sulfotelmatobacter sp.]
MRPAASLHAGDLVAVQLPPGPRWPELVAQAWEARAALLPIDDRWSTEEVGAVLERGRPTVVLDAEGARRCSNGVPVEAGIALVMATSGSTGQPRLVELSCSAVRAAVEASASTLGAGPRDGWLSCLPMAHIGGLLVVLRSLLLRAPLQVLERFHPEALARALDRDGGGRVAFTSVVPTMLVRLLDAGVDLTSLRGILVGGSGLSSRLRERAAAAGARCVSTYGQTESCGGVVYDGVPLAGVRLRISPEGEVELGGDTLMRGYRLDEQASRSALSGDGWLRTGDAGYFDAEGRLRVTGRLDEAIVSGGEKVWPGEVEEVLREHPGVADVAISARADELWGSAVVAFVVPADPASPPTLPELRDFASLRLARYKAPRGLRICSRLPRGSLGKPKREEVQRWARTTSW